MAILTSPLLAAALAAATPAAIPAPSLLPAAPTVQDEKGSDSPAIPECTAEEVVLPSGLKYCVLKEGGDGESPRRGDRVKVHYTGWFTDGTSFDSSRKARFPGAPVEPAVFPVGGVIEGWNEALGMMSPGDHWKLMIPAALGYGADGKPPAIPGNADLVFEVELLEIVGRAPQFVAWDAEAEGIIALESGISFRVLEAGEGIDSTEADLAVVGFGVFNPAGGLAFSHTMFRAGTKVPMKPSQPLLPFMGDFLPYMKKGSKIQAVVPSKLGLGAQGAPPELPEGSDEIWIFDVDSVEKFEKPDFVLPPEAELTTTASGLKYKLLKEGTGSQPTASNRVLAHYSGWLTDGSPFDSSFERGEPSEFGLNQVIAGWTEGLQLVKEGGAIILVIPPDLGYGSRNSGRIPANSTLVFHVELVAVK